MAAGTPVAAYPAPGPIDLIPGSGAGVLALTATEGLREACLQCLELDRGQVRAFAETLLLARLRRGLRAATCSPIRSRRRPASGGGCGGWPGCGGGGRRRPDRPLA